MGPSVEQGFGGQIRTDNPPRAGSLLFPGAGIMEKGSAAERISLGQSSIYPLRNNKNGFFTTNRCLDVCVCLGSQYLHFTTLATDSLSGTLRTGTGMHVVVLTLFSAGRLLPVQAGHRLTAAGLQAWDSIAAIMPWVSSFCRVTVSFSSVSSQVPHQPLPCALEYFGNLMKKQILAQHLW